MVEIFTVGGGDYLVNVFQAVAAWTGNGGYKSLLQVVMVMGLAFSALTLAFNQDWRAWINWFLGATLIYSCLMVPRLDVHVTDRLNPSLAPANVSNVPLGLALSAIGVALLLFNGWQGWHMVYRHRVGIADRTPDHA